MRRFHHARDRIGSLAAGIALAALTGLALGCATYSQPAADSEQWSKSVKNAAKSTADLTAAGARKAGSAVSTAVSGVREGFEAPDPNGYGRFPDGYARSIRHHLQHFEGVSKDASFQFGRPEKGYLNAGILAGGAITWQGYLVEVSIREEVRFESQARPDRYVVRMRDGMVVEVVEADYADTWGWAERHDPEARDSGVAANRD